MKLIQPQWQLVYGVGKHQGFQLSNNSGHVHVDYLIAQSGMLDYTLRSDTVLIIVYFY